MNIKFLATHFFCAIALLLSGFLQAYDASPRCYKDLQLNFFQTSLVSQALSLNHVDQSAWTPIVQILQEASKKIPSTIKAKAQNLRPNPLEPVFIPELAKNLLIETLFEVFSGVLISYNPYQQIRINGDDIQNMFNYIMSKQEKKMESCFGIIKK